MGEKGKGGERKRRKGGEGELVFAPRRKKKSRRLWSRPCKTAEMSFEVWTYMGLKEPYVLSGGPYFPHRDIINVIR